MCDLLTKIDPNKDLLKPPYFVSPEKTDELTPEQQKERQRSIALHMTLLSHTSTCHSTQCTSVNCIKMKGLLKHEAGCKKKVCIRVRALLQTTPDSVRRKAALYHTAAQFVSAIGGLNYYSNREWMCHSDVRQIITTMDNNGRQARGQADISSQSRGLLPLRNSRLQNAFGANTSGS